jgi:hypothetical protein
VTKSRAPERVSEILAALAARKVRQVAVGDILEAFGNRAFGALIFVFAAPLVLPMPPGVSAVLGAPLLFVAAQWTVGRRTLWLPRAILGRTMTMGDFRRLIARLEPYLRKLERRLRPRLTFLLNPVGDRLVGAICFLLAIIVFLPIPFGNMLPSLAIAAFGIGAVERDGVAVLVGWLSAALSVLVLTLLSKAIISAMAAFITTLIARLT